MAEIIVPISLALPPKPGITEPLMNLYFIVKRCEKVSKCHGFNVISELRWLPEVNKENLTKQWFENTCNHKYCLRRSCPQKRRPYLSNTNISIDSQEDH